MMRKIVVFGGAFNPPHIGHAMVIESVMRLFPCDEIWVIPSGDRRDKKIGVAGEHRLKMLQIMVGELFPNPSKPVKIPTFELDQPTLTITYDTKKELENEYPDCKFFFWVGYELIGDIKSKWVRGDELYDATDFLTMKRPNVVLPLALPKRLTILNSENLGLMNISSTLIRNLIKSGFSPLPYVTPGVAGYIEEKKLYRSPSENIDS